MLEKEYRGQLFQWLKLQRENLKHHCMKNDVRIKILMQVNNCSKNCIYSLQWVFFYPSDTELSYSSKQSQTEFMSTEVSTQLSVTRLVFVNHRKVKEIRKPLVKTFKDGLNTYGNKQQKLVTSLGLRRVQSQVKHSCCHNAIM
jgi:hypothetical protein